MNIEPTIDLVACGAVPTATLTRLHSAIRQASIRMQTPGADAAPTLVVCFATHWSDALLTQIGQHLRNHKVPVMVTIAQEAGAAETKALLGQGVWKVIGERDLNTLATAIANNTQRLACVEKALNSTLVKKNLIGESQAWRSFLRELIWASTYSTASVLLSGETGTGKELLARLIHTLDSRPDKGDLVVVDCTNLGPELAASELFGHEKGAFTGAHAARVGAATLANGGTLFLDEVGELPLTVQAQLLRLLQEGSYKTVGGSCQVPCDHVPRRSWALFKARAVLTALFSGIDLENNA